MPVTAAKLVKAFVDRGGRVIFFPPQEPGDAGFLGSRAGRLGWRRSQETLAVETWRGDQDLLAHTQERRGLAGRDSFRSAGRAGSPASSPRWPLSAGGAPLSVRLATNRGGAYFCATTPAGGDSSLATNGVVLYVAIQRAWPGVRRCWEIPGDSSPATPPVRDPTRWKRWPVIRRAISTEYPLHAGVYSVGRAAPGRESRRRGRLRARVLADGRVAELFRGSIRPGR